MNLKKPLKTLSAALLLSVVSNQAALAESALQRKAAGQIAQQVSKRFAERQLTKWDKAHPYLKSIELVIEHSLGQTDNEQKSFKSLAELEAWLTNREHDGLPGRNREDLLRCQQGLCHFEQRGLLHNNLYLRAVSYVYLNGQPYLKTLYIVDGD